MISILHTADLHLDWPFPSFPASRRALRRRELIEIFYQVIALAIERNVHAIVIAGDLFQSQIPPESALSAAITGFAQLADHGIPVFLAPGHEEARLGTLNHLELPGNVYLLSGGEITTSNLLPNLTVYGFPVNAEPDFRPLENFRCGNQPGIHLGVVHGTYTGLPANNVEDQLSPIPPEDIARSGLDYLALGHYHDYYACTHGGTQAVYPGSPVRLAFGQQEARSVVLVGLTEGPPTTERLLLRDRANIEFVFNLSRISFAEALAELENRADKEAFARVVFTGSVSDEADFFAERVMEKSALFFYLEAIDQTEIVLPPGQDTVQDLFSRRCADALAEKDLSSEERAVEEYAYRAGLVALRGGGL
jgi:DNA repair exonuclease SbcCD nuclease subunit